MGIVLGAIIQFAFGTDSKITTQSMEWIGIVGNGYVAFLQMLVIPLVFVSIVGAFTKMKESNKLGKISFNVLATLLGTTAVAALVGIGTTLAFGLQGAKFTQGAAETSRIAELATRQDAIQDLTIPQQIVSFIPKNVFADFAGTRPMSTIGVVIFAAFVGVAYLGVRRKAPKEAEFFANLIDSLYKITMRIVTLVLRLTPYGVLALMINVVATSDFVAIINLGKFVLASYVALIIVFAIHMLILITLKVNPVTYLKKVFPVLSFAFTSRSSAGALPISSFGVAGVGGGATFASLIVLGAMNLPVAIVGLVISVEPLIDMARTAVNVNDSMVAGVLTSARIHELDRDVLNDRDVVLDANI